MSQRPYLAVLVGFFLILEPSLVLALDGLGESDEPRLVWEKEELTLTLEGEAEFELHDLEGSGGAGHESPTDLRSIGTRSPFVELDSFSLSLGVGVGEHIKTHAVVSFTADGAGALGLWTDLAMPWNVWLSQSAQLGLHPPIAYRERRTERYPLIASSYWRESEIHLAVGTHVEFTADVRASLTVSAAMMRPLSFSAVQDSRNTRGTINVLAYGPARPFSGNGFVGGALLRGEAHGFFLDAFAFVGTLSAEAGTDALRSTLSRFQELPGYNTEDPSDQDTRFAWGGGRLGYEGHGLHVWAEAIISQESLLRRFGGYAQASYVVSLGDDDGFLNAIEPLVRIETLRIADSSTVLPSGQALRSPALSEAPTWDFDALTLAIRAHLYRDIFAVRAEYVFISEKNGVAELAVADAPIRNNELLLQLEARF